MASFLGEIKRRKVFQVAAVYGVVAWLLVQVVATVEQPLSLPSWLDTLVIVLVVAGFPLALILSWVFDMTPRGLVRTTEQSVPNEAIVTAEEITAETRRAPEREILSNSVAVLPFENLSPNPDDAYFAAGIHEEILNQLAQIKDLSVIARTSVMQYEGARRSVEEIANELRVSSVMEGSVRYAGNNVRVTAQLIDPRTSAHLWSRTYDRKLEDIFAIQSDIATQIAAALKAELSLHERQTLTGHATQSTEAYGVFLRAIAQFREAGNIIDPTGLPALRASIQAYLDRAIQLDPAFALAHAWKARVYVTSRQNDPIGIGEWPGRRAELEELVCRHAEKALTLDSNLGLAHVALATLHFYNWRAEEAEAAFNLALELTPNDAQVLFWYCLFEYARDNFDNAIKLAQRGAIIDPNDPLMHSQHGYAQWKAGYIEGATEAIRTALSVNPGIPLPHMFRAALETAQENTKDALEAVKAADQLMPAETAPAIRGLIAWFYGRLGQADDAKRVFDGIAQTAKHRYVDPAAWAWAYMGIGDYDRALELYREARANLAAIQDPWALHYARQNFCSDPVIEEPRFQNVLNGLWITST